MDALGDQLAVIDVCPGILQVDPSGAQALDLGAYQLDACFQCLDDKVFVAHLTVDGNHFFPTLVLCHRAHLLCYCGRILSIAHLRGKVKHPPSDLCSTLRGKMQKI